MIIELPLQVIELENDNYHILIEGKFQDNTNANWIIDTGASKSVLDMSLESYYEVLETDNVDDFHSAGINQNMMDTTVGKMFFLNFGALEINNLKVALINLDHVNEIYRKYTPQRIAGLLGGDVMMLYKCQIDYNKKTIRFEIPKTGK